MNSSKDIRSNLIKSLELDLIGPIPNLIND